jgi:hypothetical protein
MKVNIRRYGLSVAVFVLILAGLVSFDERVRLRAHALVDVRHAVTPVGTRARELGTAVSSALRAQSAENGPLLVFATVGGVLFLFMYRT